MKKILVTLILISALCMASVFAEETDLKDKNWNLSLTFGYDHQSCNDNSANAFGMTFGARTQFHNDIDLYADFSVHAWGKYKFVTSQNTKESLSDDNLGFKTHIGLLLDVPVNSANFDLGVGAGAGLSRSIASKGYGQEKTKYGFTNVGFSLIGIGRYKINDQFAVQGEFIPDIYLFNWDTDKSDSKTTTYQSSKLGLGMSIKVGISYYL